MSLKRKLRGVLDHSARATGVLRLCERRMRRGLTVLMYHRVLPDREALAYPLPTLAMPESAFRSQVAWLAAHARVVTLSEGVEQLGRGQAAETEPPRVAITFDDGYDDNARIAAPILEQAGLAATFFLTTGFVGDGEPLWFDRALPGLRRNTPERNAELGRRFSDHGGPLTPREWLARMKRVAPARRAEWLAELGPPSEDEMRAFRAMTPDDARALHERGHELGAHTVSHPLLPQLPDEDLCSELSRSRAAVEEWIGAPVTSFAYPNGDHDERVVEATRRAGFAVAATVTGGLNLAATDPLRIRRIDVTRDRVFGSAERYDAVAFRSELCRLRDFLRAS